MSHLAWMEQAESDLLAAKALCGLGYHSQAVWLAGQAVEKAHKAILVALGLQYEERHFKQFGHTPSDIARLLPEALQHPVDPVIASRVTTLQRLAMDSRYPRVDQKAPSSATALIAPAASIASSHQEVADSEMLVEWCRSRVARALLAVEAMRPPPTPG